MTFYEAFMDELDKFAAKGMMMTGPLKRKRKDFFLKGDPAGNRYFQYMKGKQKGYVKRQLRKK